jgi:hypothetical protein
MKVSTIVRLAAIGLVAVIAGCGGGQKPVLDSLPMNLGLAVGSADMMSAASPKTPATAVKTKATPAVKPVATALWLHYASSSESQPCSDGPGVSVGSTIMLTNADIPGSNAPASTMYVTLCRGKALPADVKNPNPNRKDD